MTFGNTLNSAIFILMRLLFLISLFLINVSLIHGQSLYFDIVSEAGLLINSETGHILFEKNKDKLLFPASITKAATALYILKKYEKRLDEKVIAKREALASITPQAKKQSNYRCPAYWLDTDGSHIGIKMGEEFALKTLLVAMLIASANDAANVMAEHLEGSIPKFMENMNRFLKELGCTKTHFCNPHGLHHPQHQTTAHDMALIAKAAMQHPQFQDIVSLTYFLCPRTNLSEERYLTQTNNLLRHGPYYYKKATGIKTGSTSQAGKTLLASAKNENRNLIAVVLSSPTTQDRYADVTKMFEKAFAEKKIRKHLLSAGVQKMKVKIPGGKKNLRVYLREPLYYDYYPSEPRSIKGKIQWTISKLPIMKDQTIGMATAVDNRGKIVARTPLYALETIEPTFFYKVKETVINNKKIIIQSLSFVTSISVLIYFFRKKKRRRRSLIN